MAIKAGVPVVPGTDSAMSSAAEAKEFARENGLPLMIKASMGGGGKGMRAAGRSPTLQDASRGHRGGSRRRRGARRG